MTVNWPIKTQIMELVIVGLQLAKCEATVIFLSAKRVCCSSSFLIDDVLLPSI